MRSRARGSYRNGDYITLEGGAGTRFPIVQCIILGGSVHVQSTTAAARPRTMNFPGKRKQNRRPPSPSKCRRTKHPPPPPLPLCCCCCCSSSSRLSVSSAGAASDGSEQLESLSNLAHGMVQARLEQMISQWRRVRSDECGGGGRVFLVAMDRRSYDPEGDFRRSILEVITSEQMERPKELRSLLNCYLSMNSSEHRQVILEAFHEVCSTLFL